MDNNLETKNEYFVRKEEKEKIRKEASKDKMIKKSLRWLGFVVLAGLFVWWIYGYSQDAAVKKSATVGEYFQAQSRDHIQSGAEHPAYNSNPPTGGWHYDQPAQSGIYDVEFKDEQLVHNLEHSHVWIAFKPDLPAEQIELLAEIAKDYGSKIIMAPRQSNDSSVALVAWEHLLKMETVDEAMVREFIEAYRGTAGPEKIADFGFKDFRGLNEQSSGPAMKK